jgi:hypothetical protein
MMCGIVFALTMFLSPTHGLAFKGRRMKLAEEA